MIKNYETLKWEVNDSIMEVVINREEKLNALNSKVLSELKDLLESLGDGDGSASPRGMLLRGAGQRAFIAGADIEEMAEMGGNEGRAFGILGQEVTLLLERVPFPVIACVHGHALGGGCEMAMACDFIYATEKASFALPEVKLGLIPGFGGTQRLARLVGRNRAKEIVYTGRMLGAREAFELGLVVRVFKDQEELLKGAYESFNLMKKVSSHSIAHAKKAFNKGVDLKLEQGLDCERECFVDVFDSKDKQEGIAAFREKRAPQF